MAQALTELPKSATGAAVSDWLFLDSAAAQNAKGDLLGD